MIKVKAIANGTYPEGCHWSAGEVRDMALESDQLPSFLVEVKAKAKAKNKSKKAQAPKDTV
jgi:hypothetical protein